MKKTTATSSPKKSPKAKTKKPASAAQLAAREKFKKMIADKKAGKV